MQVGTIFALIFAVIMMGAVLVFGFDQIMAIFGLGAQAQLQKAVTDLDTLTEEVYYMARGSSRTYILRIPTGTKLCFITTPSPGRATYPQKERWWCPGNPDCLGDDQEIVEYMITTQTSEYYNSNIWLYQHLEDRGMGVRIPHLAPEACANPDNACSFCAVSGTELYLENKGLFVEVSILE